MLRACALGFLAATLFGCGPKYSKLKVDDIQSVSVLVANASRRFCAHEPVALRTLVKYRDGKQAVSRAPGERQRGRLRTSEFQWSSSHGTIDADAVLAPPPDTLAWFDQPIRVSATVIARPELVGEVTLQPSYDCGGTVDIRGAEGARGGEFEYGGPGEPGPEVHVALSYIDSQHSGRLLLVRIRHERVHREHYILDPRNPKAKFAIDARGGNGGRGGQGILGIDGSPGADGLAGADGVGCADGAPGQNGTDGQPGGSGGHGANGGRGGRGGRVFVRYDARFPELAAKIRIRVEGGVGGEAGPGSPGGRGGRGGKGGAGGRGGSDVAANCTGSDGNNGTDGSDGSNGNDGRAGTPGMAGHPGEVQTSAAGVAELFAEEIARGIAIVTGAEGSP